jgi:cold shock CspA family protein
MTTESESTNYVGQVKWFNNRLGYGFITIISEGERKNEDIFVHQQHITPKSSDYRSLQQGEYVSFQLGTPDTSEEGAKHVNQAVKVTGVFGGSLMCDQIPRSTPRAPRPTTHRPTGGAGPSGAAAGGDKPSTRPPRSNNYKNTTPKA